MKLAWTAPAVLLTAAVLLCPWTSAAFVSPAEGDAPPGCEPDALRCWFLVFGTTNAPERKAYLVDARMRQMSPDIRRVRIAEARESKAADQPEYYFSTVDFDCKTRQLRLVEEYRAWRDNRMDHNTEVSKWIPVPKAWHERAWTFACDPAALRDPAAYQIMHLVDVYRPADAIAFVRQTLWREGPPPRFRDEVDP
ncbi:hypothetical protein [Pseudoxanthomonas winnipegensis]|uniref:hypothetical protein n=1 Tax=Pseudoxanthomonas winnipegensis TaxID=2480810 RepID=UPI003F831F50